MNFQDAILRAQDAVTVKRVYGDPYERDGVVVIPAAKVSGGGGGGSGEDPTRGGSGSGGGFGVGARPVGAYVIRDGRVRWKPAVDITRVVGQIAVGALAIAWLLRSPR